MARLQRIPVRSLGSDAATPTVQELAGWVGRRKGTPGDLTSFLLEETLLPQEEVEQPCAGGLFYRARLLETIEGIEEEALVREPSVDTTLAEVDARWGASWKKGIRFSIPAPHALGIADEFYHDRDEFCTGLLTVYRTLMRAMRDSGAGGHVILGTRVLEEELEGLSAPRTFFYYSELSEEDLPTLLEYKSTIAVPRDLLSPVLELLDEYGVRSLILVDGREEEILAAAEHEDLDRISLGGYCREACGAYWKELRERAVIPR